MSSIQHLFRLIVLLVICSNRLLAGGPDSLAVMRLQERSAALYPKTKEAKHYIRPTLWLSNFGTAAHPLTSKNTVPAQILTNRLGNYRFAQTNLGFYAPLYTSAKFKGGDSTNLNTFHLLFTFNALNDRPEFSGLEKQHVLYKTGIGLRAIWAFGSEHVILWDFSPFVTGDRYDKQRTQRARLASTFVWNCTPKSTSWFSFRLGLTRTYLLGNRFSLPVIGFRLGKLDGPVYFSFQYPRNAALVFQPKPKISFSLYSRYYGGLYNISNSDSIYLGSDSVIQFGQSGLANGLRFDFRPNPNFSFFVSSGLAVNNKIWLYSWTFNRTHNQRPFAHFYDGKTESSFFLHFGVAFRFGKAKNSAGNTLMYDVFDLNNTFDPGDNNDGPGNGNIPKRSDAKDAKKIQYKDVSDLIEESDLY